MNAQKINYLNALVLMVVGLWGYIDVQSPTALIPVVFGFILFMLHFITIKKPTISKFILPISFVVTVMILGALAGVRLPKSLESGGVGLVRVILMVAFSGVSVGYFIKDFFSKK